MNAKSYDECDSHLSTYFLLFIFISFLFLDSVSVSFFCMLKLWKIIFPFNSTVASLSARSLLFVAMKIIESKLNLAVVAAQRN